MTPLQETIIAPTSDMHGWSASMSAAAFVLRAPLDATGTPELRFVRSGPAWRFDTDQLDAILATLREASRYFRKVWRFEPAAGRVFGPSDSLSTRRTEHGIEIHSRVWHAAAEATGHLQVPYTDLHQLRARLGQQRRVIRYRKAHHDIHTH
jgi:hypothetical protein